MIYKTFWIIIAWLWFSIYKLYKDIKKYNDNEFLIFYNNLKQNKKYKNLKIEVVYKLWKIFNK